MTVFLELLGVAVLILLNGFFVAAEYSLVTVRRTRLKELVDEGNRPARAVMTITSDPPHFIAAMQLGVTLTSLAIGAIGEAVLSDLFGIYLGTFARRRARVPRDHVHARRRRRAGSEGARARATPSASPSASPCPCGRSSSSLAPLIWVLQRSSEAAQRLIGIDPKRTEGDVHSEAELKMLLEVSTVQGEIEQGEREMLYKVFDFADKEASDVMVPRPEVVGISIEMPPEEALSAVLESPYTRYPVYRDSLDEIVGVLHVRDLISALHDRAMARDRARGPFCGPPTSCRRRRISPPCSPSSAARTSTWRSSSTSTARCEGIVTLEDLLEEIVGEIEDEFDLPDESIERLNETTIRIDGTFPIDDFNEEFGTELEHEDYHTVAGYVFDLIGRAAEPGDEVRTDGLRFTVLDVEGSRIQRLEVEFLPVSEARRRSGRRVGVEPGGLRHGRGDSPLKHRDFVLFLGVMVATGFAIEMSFVAVGWQVYAVRSNPLDLGLVGLAMFLPLPLLALPAGHAADRFPRRTILASRDDSRHRSAARAPRGHARRCQPDLAVLSARLRHRSCLGRSALPHHARMTPSLVPRRHPRPCARDALDRVPGVGDRRPGGRRPVVRRALGARLRGRRPGSRSSPSS